MDQFDSVCELFGETIHNMFGCGCYLLLNVMEMVSVDGGASRVLIVCVITHI